ncbi:thiamine-phosphate kinase [Aquipuribacter sp. MA13-6]|uniref:thiamine-phosphate kinase n=1 Tax=unclassified Aquipuribacter TaxID=2635084 RepID=UPI003EEF554D
MPTRDDPAPADLRPEDLRPAELDHDAGATGTAGSRVADVGEDALVRAVVARLRPAAALDGGPARVLVGPGDDAAVLEVDGPLVTSTDTLVEGVDFRTDWSGAEQVGRKAVVQVLADVEAMGAVGVGLLVSLVVPGGTPVGWCLGLADGIAAEASRAGVAVLGGDVADGGALVVTGTSFGVLRGPRPATCRDGARPGDVVALGGAVGASAAGLELLQRGRAAVDGLAADVAAAVDRVVGVHRAPRPDHTAGPRARAAGARALIDVSDGLVRDATRLARASGVDLRLRTTDLAPGQDLLLVAGLLGLPDDRAQEWVLTSGEEHSMLACFPAGATLPAGFVPVGEVAPAGEEGPLVRVDGVARRDPGGWTHYGRRP